MLLNHKASLVIACVYVVMTATSLLCIAGEQITRRAPSSAFNVAFNLTRFYGHPMNLYASLVNLLNIMQYT